MVALVTSYDLQCRPRTHHHTPTSKPSIFCSNDSLKCDPVPSGGGFSGRRVRAFGLSRCDTLCILATLQMCSVESRKSMLIVCTCVRTVLEVNEVPAPKVDSASSTAKSGPVTNYIYNIYILQLHHIMHCLCILLIVLYNLSAMRVYSGLFEADRMAQLEDRVLHQETIIKALQAG